MAYLARVRVWQAWLVPWAPFWWGRRIAWQKSNIVTCSFFSLYFAPYTTNTNCTAEHSTQRPLIQYGVLRQHQVLWQNCYTIIVTQHNGQTLRQNKNARMPYLQSPSSCYKKRSVSPCCCVSGKRMFVRTSGVASPKIWGRRKNLEGPICLILGEYQNVVVMSLSPWLWEPDCYANNCWKSYRFTNYLKLLQPTPTLRNFFDGH